MLPDHHPASGARVDESRPVRRDVFDAGDGIRVDVKMGVDFGGAAERIDVEVGGGRGEEEEEDEVNGSQG